MKRRPLLACAAVAAAAVLLLPGAEPAFAQGSVPSYRARGPSAVVCRPDSRARLRRVFRFDRRLLRRRLAVLRRCRFHALAPAVDAARTGWRILILPGVYREAVGVVGATDLQIEGLGRRPQDVVIQGDRRQDDVLRIERAVGVYVRNLTVEQGAANAIDLVRVDGFRLSRVIARYAQAAGVAVSSSPHGLADHVEAYGNGLAGVSTSLAECSQPVELRAVDAHGNVAGYSGASAWVHDSEFRDNAAGLATQGCTKLESNRVHANNANVFTAERQELCNRVPFAQRDKEVVCPQVAVPVGTGIVMTGALRSLVSGNYVFDQWKWGLLLRSVPAGDTSSGNVILANRFGVGPDGVRDPNALDVVWDGEGERNCFQDNTFASGRGRRSDPAALPGCPSSPLPGIPNALIVGRLLPCAAWNRVSNPRPVGCDWFDTPSEPG